MKKPVPAHKPLAVFALLLSTFCLTMALAAEPVPLPSPQQLAWQRREFIAFAHFGMNTFTDREWSEGKEDPKVFNPTDFDAHQWAAMLKDAGVKLLMLTAKHHDWFCLWPSQFTEGCVKRSPWRGSARQGEVTFGSHSSNLCARSTHYRCHPRLCELARGGGNAATSKHTRTERTMSPGGVDFLSCYVHDAVARPALGFEEGKRDLPLRDVHGQILVTGPGTPSAKFGSKAESVDLTVTRAVQ